MWSPELVEYKNRNIRTCVLEAGTSNYIYVTCNYLFACVTSFKHIIHHIEWVISINSPPAGAAYMRQWIGSALVQPTLRQAII